MTESAQVAMTPYAAVALAAFRGTEAQAAQFIATARRDSIVRGEGIGVSLTSWAHAVLCNGLGRYAEALAAAREAAANPEEMPLSNWALVELVEAALRAGDPATATTAFAQLSAKARTSGTEWASGIAARSEAREQLRTADEALTAIGMKTFVGRARRELAATGETVRKRTEDTRHDLTAQELHIARLAAAPTPRSALSCSSAREPWSGILGRVFLKLGISARRELRDALNHVGRPGPDSVGMVGQLLDQGRP